jgi:DNA mismatch repair protein MutS
MNNFDKLKKKNILVSDYFDTFKFLETQFGKKICVLMQIGSFYEIQQIKNNKIQIGNADEISQLLNIQLTKKNKKIIEVTKSNPLMCGFPMPALNKYLHILLKNNYTVVTIDQLSAGPKTDRKISKIYSPGLPPLLESDEFNLSDTFLLNRFMCSIFIEKCSPLNFCCGLTFIDITTGQIELYEIFSTDGIDSLLDKCYSILQKYQIVEYVLTIHPFTQNEIESILKHLDIYNQTTHIIPFTKELSNLDLQETFFKKVYLNSNQSMLSYIEFLDLEKYVFSRYSFINLLEFIFQHNESYLTKLSKPTFIQEQTNLSLASNTIQQLNLVPTNSSKLYVYDSLFSVLNNVTTVLGKRHLRSILTAPFIDTTTIQMRYDLTEEFSYFDQKQKSSIQVFELILSEICDITRLHRKMGLGLLHPYEFAKLYQSYIKIEELFLLITTNKKCKAFKEWCDNLQFDYNLFQNYIQTIQETFIIEHLDKINLNGTSQSELINFYKSGVNSEINELSLEMEKYELEFKKLCTQLSKLIDEKGDEMCNYIKLGFLESEGYYLTTTNVRAEVLKKKLQKSKDSLISNLHFKSNKSGVKITSETIDTWSSKLILLRNNFKEALIDLFISKMNNYFGEYSILFDKMTLFIETIDITKSNYKTAVKYKYTKPILRDTCSSYFSIKGMRHPILERILQDTKYITNDISLDNKSSGIVLYGLNACGKSSLLRAVGLNIIMAQCGLYTACDHMEFTPFHNLITQVDLHDNMWKGQSSFITEMLSLRNILKLSDQHSLILADELCKGSEMISATAIFASAIQRLLQKGAKFMFTTHLHKVAELSEITSDPRIGIKHLSVNVINNEIVFERILKDGPCASLYGLEVAKALDMDPLFINTAFKIRNTLTNKKENLVSTKKSKYNSKKIVDQCELCGYYPKLQTDQHLHTHHINFQCNADDKGFIDHFHKNTKFNLVTLCSDCHSKVHEHKINIQGYTQTSSGIKLVHS